MDWNAIWNEIAGTNPGLTDICLRLACAMLVGLVIGTEREYTHRPAGMRTHILVSLGACVVAIAGELIFHEYHALGANPDPARLSAQVITGVGFLGAGTILREGAIVKGLTTAASVWAVACLGLVAGSGYYGLALAGMVFIFLTLTVFEVIQHRWLRKNLTRQSYSVETGDVSEALRLLFLHADACHAIIQNMEVENKEDCHIITFEVIYFVQRGQKLNQKFVEKLAAEKVVLKLRQSVHI